MVKILPKKFVLQKSTTIQNNSDYSLFVAVFDNGFFSFWKFRKQQRYE
jgi:hypothetical protein